MVSSYAVVWGRGGFGSAGVSPGGVFPLMARLTVIALVMGKPGLEDAETLLWAIYCLVGLALSLEEMVEQEFGTADKDMVVPR